MLAMLNTIRIRHDRAEMLLLYTARERVGRGFEWSNCSIKRDPNEDKMKSTNNTNSQEGALPYSSLLQSSRGLVVWTTPFDHSFFLELHSRRLYFRYYFNFSPYLRKTPPLPNNNKKRCTSSFNTASLLPSPPSPSGFPRVVCIAPRNIQNGNGEKRKKKQKKLKRRRRSPFFISIFKMAQMVPTSQREGIKK